MAYSVRIHNYVLIIEWGFKNLCRMPWMGYRPISWPQPATDNIKSEDMHLLPMRDPNPWPVRDRKREYPKVSGLGR